MARDLMDVELGYSISEVNGGRLAYILSGTAIPDGVSGKQSEAPIGSLYLRSGTPEIYKKIANAGAPADYEEISSLAIDQLIWRNEKVRFVSNDTLSAGTFDITTLSDNDDMVIGDINVGEYCIGDLDGVPALFEITAKPGGNQITIAAAGQAIGNNDTFVVQQYLPDVSGQENAAIVHIPVAGSPGIKISDVDWAIATGISLSGSYTPASGNPVSGDSVESALEKIDGNVDQLTSAVGVAQGDGNMGTYTGAFLNDNESAKQNLQQLETEAENSRSTLGTSIGDSNMGTYTGNLLNDNESAKQNLQQLEDYAEAGRLRFSGTVAQSANALVDSFLVDEFQGVKWVIVARDTANPANVKRFTIDAVHDGHGAADATDVDSVKSKILSMGSFNLDSLVQVSGAAGAQIVELRLDTSEVGGITYTVERVEFMPLAG